MSPLKARSAVLRRVLDDLAEVCELNHRAKESAEKADEDDEAEVERVFEELQNALESSEKKLNDLVEYLKQSRREWKESKEEKTENGEVDVKPKVGMLKLVSIEKLLDPTRLPEPKKDDLVIVLSDGESEKSEPRKTRAKRKVVKQKRWEKMPCSDEEFSKKKDRRTRKTRRREPSPSLSSSSRSSSEERVRKSRSSRQRMTRKKWLPTPSSSSSEKENEPVRDKSEDEKEVKRNETVSDEKLRRAYVSLPRVPCEQLLELYLKDSKMFEAQCMADSTRKRPRNKTGSDSDNSIHKQKSKKVKLPKDASNKETENSTNLELPENDDTADKCTTENPEVADEITVQNKDDDEPDDSKKENESPHSLNLVETAESDNTLKEVLNETRDASVENVLEESKGDKSKSKDSTDDSSMDNDIVEPSEPENTSIEETEKCKEQENGKSEYSSIEEKEKQRNQEIEKEHSSKPTLKNCSSEAAGTETEEQRISENDKDLSSKPTLKNSYTVNELERNDLPDSTEPEKQDNSDSETEKETPSKTPKKKVRFQSEEEIVKTSDSEDNFVKFSAKKDKQKKKLKKTKKKMLLSSDEEQEEEEEEEQHQQDEAEKSQDKIKEVASESSEKESDIEEKKKPTRRRIKRVKDSSSDEQNESSPEKSTRKQIRKVIGKSSLSESTKLAEKEERERKARIAEKQKKYNQIFDEDALQKSTVDKIVLDFDDKTKTELLTVHKDLVKYLKPHQAAGVQFMWDACFESLERAKKPGSGCILAHCMGLGKTLQVIALSHTLLSNSEKTGVERVMVVCPLNTVLNWVAEYKQWLPKKTSFDVFEIVSYKQNGAREFVVSEWFKEGGVLIIGYDMFRNLTNDKNKRMPKKMRSKFMRSLVDPGPDVVVCDEGHLLKNEKTSLSIAMNRLKTLRRIVLTGTPLQNNLKEYYCMVQFVKPNLLGTYREYLNRFVNPITNGQYTDSTPMDIHIMRRRSHVLHKMLDGVVQRKDYCVLAPYLPPKYEYVLFLTLTQKQIELYRHYLQNIARNQSETYSKGKTSFLFVDFQSFQRICTHPKVLQDKSIEDREKKMNETSEEESDGSMKDFIDDEDDAKSTSSDSESKSDSDISIPEKSTSKPKTRVTRAAAAAIGGIEEIMKQQEEETKPVEWWSPFLTDDDLEDPALSGKLFLLMEILKQCESIGDKILVFSQSLYSLNVIEYFLQKIDEATQNGTSCGGFTGSWSLGLDYFRIDGSSSCDNRAAWCKTFNDPDNIRARLFLISTRAGGLGINLVAANRVIIFDVSWNPSHDTQSIYRVYRFGQTKPCYIYRFVTMGTMEMKIYERQVTKQAISKRVIDEQQIDRHYNQNDLMELYKFDPIPEGERPTPLVPKDVLLGELLQNFSDRIYKYHEHQSLLENKEDEVLDEDERKAAWEEFENEKNSRSYTAGTWNGIQLTQAAAAIKSILQREYPQLDARQTNLMVPTMMKQVEEEMKVGNVNNYGRIVAEVKKLHAQQEQKMREFYLQQQAMRMMQQQYALAGQTQYLNALEQMRRQQMGERSNAHMFNPAAPSFQPNEVIDLNE